MPSDILKIKFSRNDPFCPGLAQNVPPARVMDVSAKLPYGKKMT